ncbi:hypothetical protein EVAR_17385_1 [Eumeta japonica]|uniref:Uncharacterized protein n=1 Tax=Eumeta variegata TaxID=151549 RepID=A0A4C1VC44_EUMVA|nr:hypothetical protein EVAR_17385_1 [Eumeta japonica]
MSQDHRSDTESTAFKFKPRASLTMSLKPLARTLESTSVHSLDVVIASATVVLSPALCWGKLRLRNSTSQYVARSIPPPPMDPPTSRPYGPNRRNGARHRQI